jgi:hypothetical protein
VKAERFAELCRLLPVGKQIGSVTYVGLVELYKHTIVDDLAKLVRRLARRHIAQVVKLDPKRMRLSLLAYPGLERDPWPSLAYSVLIDLVTGERTRRRASTTNPPVLHRKELMWPSHKQAPAWAELTARCELAGLFKETTTIGTRRGWRQRMREQGFVL